MPTGEDNPTQSAEFADAGDSEPTSARTRAFEMVQSAVTEQLPDDSALLKDVAAAADICRCNPCRCDPLRNDCTVSCNPVAEPYEPAPEICSPEVPRKSGGCGCSCGRTPRSSTPLVAMSCSQQQQQQETDADPCCIVVCIKHLKRQCVVAERPHCCV
jgi:hypothetical protein